MKKQIIFGKKTASCIAVLALAALMLSGCSKTSNNNNTTTPPTTKGTRIISGTLSGNIIWSADTVYQLSGIVRVGSDNSVDGSQITQTGVLTIPAGTVVVGLPSTNPTEIPGTLIIQRGSKIMAEGTSTNPIVFSSAKSPGLKRPGDWGGLVICGKSVNNITGGAAELEGGYGGYHGGADAHDNSGILKYVRIEYAGFPIHPNQEINSLTMASVGDGTTISYVQASYGADDQFEWFGGTVNCDHLIAYRGQDDEFDTDNGFSGYVQFGLGIRDNNIADQSGSNAFESDNDAAGSLNTPFTSAIFSNMTIIGPKEYYNTYLNTNFGNGAQIRRSSKMKIYNSFITGYPVGIYIDGGAGSSVSFAQGGDIAIKNTVLTGVQYWGGNGFGSAGSLYINATTGLDSLTNQFPALPRGSAFKTTSGSFDVTAWFMTPSFNNTFLPKWQDAGISPSIFELGTPNVLPNSGSILLSGSDYSVLPSFFQQVAYVGAFGSVDWTTGWTLWDPNSKKYF
ncbi:MAG: hypothetical protein JWN78_1345 [Bacteroidota bacterium]|nr:hypothetical protein [Bacteroidota bacterium]